LDSTNPTLLYTGTWESSDQYNFITPSNQLSSDLNGDKIDDLVLFHIFDDHQITDLIGNVTQVASNPNRASFLT
jgi:hypothetical protein